MTAHKGSAKYRQHALIDYTPDGDIVIPDQWTGYYSQLQFTASELEQGVLLQVCLDKEDSLRLDAYCEDGETFLETLDILDVCLAAAKGIDLQAQGIDMSQRLPAIGVILELLENPSPNDIPHSRKAKSIRTALAKHLRGTLAQLSQDLIKPKRKKAIPALSLS